MIRRSVCSRGFTLVELLVVLAIISVLAAFLVLSIRNRDRSAKIEQCKANLVAIADAMESFKASDGEYIHSGDYKYKDGTSVRTLTLNFGTAENTSEFYNSEDDVDVAMLIEHSDVGICSAFKNLPVQCPADDVVRTAASTSYKIKLNPNNYTIYCTCGELHGLSTGFPRYLHGVGSNGQITVDAKVQTQASD